MKSKIRNMVIRISYIKQLEWIMFLILGGLIISVVALDFSALVYRDPVIIVLTIIVLLGFCINECFCAIREKPREIVEINKLINIILSDECVWLYPIVWGMYIIGNFIFIVLNIETTLINRIIFNILIVILAIILSLVLSKIFKKRLVQ